MWIRSQNKGFLVDTKALGIFQGTDGYCAIQSLDNNIQNFESIVLGYYTTSEKANEVLDIIQARIEHGNKSIKKDRYDLHINQVFEMPQEDEV